METHGSASSYSPLVTKPCPVCGREFTSYQSVDQKCCSRQCGSRKAVHKLYTHRCKRCRVQFQSRKPDQRYCTRACYDVAKRK